MIKYVPVMRHQKEERAALAEFTLPETFLPLIEIVKDKQQINSRKSFDEFYPADLAAIKRPLMVDFPTYLPIRGRTKPEVASFLRPLQNDIKLRVSFFKRLQAVPGMIPVVTYNPQVSYAVGTIRSQTSALRKDFPRLAFRLFLKDATAAAAEVAMVAKQGDIVLLDLDERNLTNALSRAAYAAVASIKGKVAVTTVLIRSAIESEVTNTGLEDNEPIPDADNVLLTDYSRHGFDAFGDYVGIKKTELTKGGTRSPGFIFFAWPENLYVGWRGRNKELSEFEQYIAPAAMSSRWYKAFGASHKKNCPGCRAVQRVIAGTEEGANQGKWKRFSMLHYLYTLSEVL